MHSSQRGAGVEGWSGCSVSCRGMGSRGSRGSSSRGSSNRGSGSVAPGRDRLYHAGSQVKKLGSGLHGAGRRKGDGPQRRCWVEALADWVQC